MGGSTWVSYHALWGRRIGIEELSGGDILGRVGSVLDRWGWRMNEGGDGFDEVLD